MFHGRIFDFGAPATGTEFCEFVQVGIDISIPHHKSSLIRQKCESQHGGNKKTKHTKFSEKTNISYLLIYTRTCVYQGVKNVRFSENLARFAFLLPPFKIHPSALLQMKYQVKPHSSPRISAASAADIAHRNHLFHLYQRNKSSESKVKFKEASNPYERVLGAARFANANKTRVSHLPETRLSGLLVNC